MQDIRLEAVTQPGELFHAPEWGWGMLEFLQSEDDELTRLEMTERVREKLGARPEVDAGSISVSDEFEGDVIRLPVRFRFADSETEQSMTVELNRVNVEVNVID